MGIHNGENTHHQDQVITPINFSTKKMRKRTVQIPIPVSVFFFIVIVLIFWYNSDLPRKEDSLKSHTKSNFYPIYTEQNPDMLEDKKSNDRRNSKILFESYKDQGNYSESYRDWKRNVPILIELVHKQF